MIVYDNLSGLLKFSLLEKFSSQVLDFVTTKQNPYGKGENFNIGFSGGEISEIQANRLELAKALELKPENFVFQNQIHSSNVFVVTKKQSGSGFYQKETAIQDTDILLTNEKNICLITRSADCAPVLLYSPDSNSIAAIHSGRKGTLLEVSSIAVKEMQKQFGADPTKIIACIGPSIGFDCYEVDFDCANEFFGTSFYRLEMIKKVDGKFYLDLKAMIFNSLVLSGVDPKNIEISEICTKCAEKRFFSARRGEKQRFCAGIMLK